MNTLADLLSYVVTALQRSGRCSAVRVLDTQSFSARQYAIKVRAESLNGDVLQIRIYDHSGHVDYSYQLLRAGEPLMRWDNKEHFPEIASYPHHFHSPSGEVRLSPLTGDVTTDLPLVLTILDPSGQA
ncbi:toxin-antitoxin system TumE family protein [Candidatus Amarolinea aalborgensis]|uniref:toxin-antitoxin system TumE family protein n=1 Tax=Candidatus Amarolinea aalborgensis TaxID=2249329 RepID=UPI003BF9969C